MKKSFLILLTILGGICCALQAQVNALPGEWITVNIDMTDSMTVQRFGFDGKSKLETKVQALISRNGTACKVSCVKNTNFDPNKIDLGDLTTGIICKPKLEVVDEEIANTGMEKLAVVKVSLSLFIQSLRGNVVFSYITKEYQGSGKDNAQALNNAVSSITVKDIEYERFLKNARNEIIRYYDQMCGTIVEQAISLSKFRRYQDAIFLLWPIPQEVRCHAEARDTMVSIYKQFVDYNCNNFLYNARTYMASNEFTKATAELRKIDAEASCAKDALALMEQIAPKVDAQERQYFELYKKMREDELELQKERYRSMANMTVSQTKVEIQDKR